jgi:malate dehydrogenase (quinone)
MKEVKGFGGFPVSGEWLRTNKPELTSGHHAKVYGLPPLGAPPMSVPHLDTRVITGKDWLLFGPFAGWSPKFLKTGKVTDLPLSVKPDNLLSMVGVGLTELSLLKYLIGELLQSFGDRVDTLRQFAPTAAGNDWELDIAGQRVQVIRRDSKKLGVLEFGTTVLSAADGSIAGLLGASPGASTAVPAMIEVMQRCFADEYPSWEPILKEMVPSLGSKLSEEPRLFAEVWEHGTRVLGLGAGAGEPEPAGVV